MRKILFFTVAFERKCNRSQETIFCPSVGSEKIYSGNSIRHPMEILYRSQFFHSTAYGKGVSLFWSDFWVISNLFRAVGRGAFGVALWRFLVGRFAEKVIGAGGATQLARVLVAHGRQRAHKIQLLVAAFRRRIFPKIIFPRTLGNIKCSFYTFWSRRNTLLN